MPLPPPRRLLAGAACAVAALGLTGCGAVTVPAGPAAADPACAPLVANAPAELLGQKRHETTSQGTVAWGDGDATIVLRCGVTPPGPTTDPCTAIADAGGATVDWLVSEEDDVVTFTTFGRTPAVDMTVPRAAAPDQPSAAVLDMTRLISQIPATDHCVGAGDIA